MARRDSAPIATAAPPRATAMTSSKLTGPTPSTTVVAAVVRAAPTGDVDVVRSGSGVVGSGVRGSAVVTRPLDAVRALRARGVEASSVRYTGQMVPTGTRTEVRPARPGGGVGGTLPTRPSGSSDGPAPALRRGLAVLQLLAARPSPVSASAIARDLGLPRSTTYELLTELAAAGFAIHLPGERRWGLGLSAFEIGSAYLRGEPLERIGRPVIARLSAATSTTAHLGVLHGAEMLYLGKERRSGGLLTLVTEVGVRLPAALTATGLSILAHLPADQVRAVFPDRTSFVLRTGRGPETLPPLRRDLAAVRRRGWAVEDGLVSAGTASVAAAVFDHHARPIAALGVTFAHRCADSTGPDAHRQAGTDCCHSDFAEVADPVRRSAQELTAAIGGRWVTG